MFNFLKNKSSVFLILVITFSISLSSFSSTFTALSGAIFNTPKASAATQLTFTNKPSDPVNLSVCVYKRGTAPVAAVKAESFSIPSNVSNTGDVYVAYINNSSSCFPFVNATPTASSEFVLISGHQTEVALSTYVFSTAAVASSVLYNEIPKLTSINGPKGSAGDVSNYTLCQGNTNAVKVTFEDANIDDLSGYNLIDSDIQSSSFDVSTKGKLTYTFYPTTSSVANNAGFDVTFSASDMFTPASVTPTPSILYGPAVISKTIRFSVSNNCEVASSSSSITSLSSSTNYFNYYNNNGPSYSCQGGNYDSFVSNNYFYNSIVGAFCNIYWSGFFYPNYNGPIDYYPPINISSSSYGYNNSSSVGYSSLTQEPIYNSFSIIAPFPASLTQFETLSSITQPVVTSSSIVISSIASNPTSYSISPNCPVSVNDSINYYGGGHISLQNNSQYTSNNLSANINLPAGVTVYGLEKGYNFYQNGNNLNISFPEVGPYGEISTFYTTSYLGSDYNSSTVINCNQVVNPSVSSAIAAFSSNISSVSTTQSNSSNSNTNSVLPVISSTSMSSQEVVTGVKQVCSGEIFEILESCICPEPRMIFDTSTEVDHYHICKLPVIAVPVSSSVSSALEASANSLSSIISTSSVNASMMSSTINTNCDDSDLIGVGNICICPDLTKEINIVVIAGVSDSVCVVKTNRNGFIPATLLSSSTSSLTSSTILETESIPSITSNANSSTSSTVSLSSTINTNCDDSDLIGVGNICICPDLTKEINIVVTAEVSDSVCVDKMTPSISSSSTLAISTSAAISSSTTIIPAPSVATGGVIAIGGIGGSTDIASSSTQSLVSSEASNQTVRLSGQLAARDTPATCEDSVKVNGVCASQGTLDARQVQTNAASSDSFGIEDPYTCGSSFKGKVTNTSSKIVKYEFFKNGVSTPSFSYEVPVNVDGTFELLIDYNVIPEDTYKIVYFTTNNSGTIVSESIEEFVTNKCTGANALAYYANKTIRTGGQGLAPFVMVIFGIFALLSIFRFAASKPRIS